MDRDDLNPYAPPLETHGAPPSPRPAEGGTLSLSAQGWDIVTGLAKWMRIVGAAEWVAAGILLVFGLAALGMASRLETYGASWGLLAMVGVLVFGVLFALGGLWLRQAAGHFYDGVLSDAERPLADGFRKLRLYLIFYGIYSIFGLVSAVYSLVSAHKGG